MTAVAVVPRRRRFYTGLALAIALTVFAGFAPTYYLRPWFQSTGLGGLLHLHGLVFTAWVLLFLTQSTLIAATVWGGLAIVISQPLRLAISGTGLWLGFARWLT